MYTSLFSFDYMKGSFKVFCLATNVLLMVWCFSLNLQLYVTVIPDSYGLHPFGGLLAAYKVGLLLCWFACLWLDYELLICWFLRVVELRTTHFLVCMCVVGQRATNLLVCMCVVGRTTHLLVCMCIVGLRATHLLVCSVVGLRATHLLVCIVLLDYEQLICWFVRVLLDYIQVAGFYLF